MSISIDVRGKQYRQASVGLFTRVTLAERHTGATSRAAGETHTDRPQPAAAAQRQADPA